MADNSNRDHIKWRQKLISIQWKFLNVITFRQMETDNIK